MLHQTPRYLQAVQPSYFPLPKLPSMLRCLIQDILPRSFTAAASKPDKTARLPASTLARSSIDNYNCGDEEVEVVLKRTETFLCSHGPEITQALLCILDRHRCKPISAFGRILGPSSELPSKDCAPGRQYKVYERKNRTLRAGSDCNVLTNTSASEIK